MSNAMPTVRPLVPHFSSGPCAKRPGWSLSALTDALLGRSHRSKIGRAKLKRAIDLTREVLRRHFPIAVHQHDERFLPVVLHHQRLDDDVLVDAELARRHGRAAALLVAIVMLGERDMVLLKEGGFKKQMAGFNVERLGNSSRSLALGRYAFERARDWALQRKQFGRLLAEFQGLQWKFADMKIKLDAAQLLLYRAAANADRGFPSPEETAIAKAYCNQAGFEVANEALQVMGGTGYSQEALVEYCLRRCRGWMIAGGSIEILKNRIAEGIFGRSFSQRADKA